MKTLAAMIVVFVLVVLGITILILKIAEKLGRNISSYLAFGIATGFCCLIVTGISLFDILTPGGDLNGMLGQILLLVYVPTPVVMIIGDIIAWHINKKKKID